MERRLYQNHSQIITRNTKHILLYTSRRRINIYRDEINSLPEITTAANGEALHETLSLHPCPSIVAVDINHLCPFGIKLLNKSQSAATPPQIIIFGIGECQHVIALTYRLERYYSVFGYRFEDIATALIQLGLTERDTI